MGNDLAAELQVDPSKGCHFHRIFMAHACNASETLFAAVIWTAGDLKKTKSATNKGPYHVFLPEAVVAAGIDS